LFHLQLCGSRGGGNAAARAVFWQARKGLSYTLAFETDRDRNAAIMIARKFASNCNVCFFSGFVLLCEWYSENNMVYAFLMALQVALTGPGNQGT